MYEFIFVILSTLCIALLLRRWCKIDDGFEIIEFDPCPHSYSLSEFCDKYKIEVPKHPHPCNNPPCAVTCIIAPYNCIPLPDSGAVGGSIMTSFIALPDFLENKECQKYKDQVKGGAE